MNNLLKDRELIENMAKSNVVESMLEDVFFTELEFDEESCESLLNFLDDDLLE